MEGTCNPTCPLWQVHNTQCPNYLESWWTPKDGGQPLLIKDCAPRRSLLMLQDIHNRLEELTSRVEKREVSQMNVLNTFMEVMQYVANPTHSQIPMGRISIDVGGAQRVGDVHATPGEDSKGHL